jgi:hypothetical protein
MRGCWIQGKAKTLLSALSSPRTCQQASSTAWPMRRNKCALSCSSSCLVKTTFTPFPSLPPTGSRKDTRSASDSLICTAAWPRSVIFYSSRPPFVSKTCTTRQLRANLGSLCHGLQVCEDAWLLPVHALQMRAGYPLHDDIVEVITACRVTIKVYTRNSREQSHTYEPKRYSNMKFSSTGGLSMRSLSR